jgi:hypothetical protein
MKYSLGRDKDRFLFRLFMTAGSKPPSTNLGNVLSVLKTNIEISGISISSYIQIFIAVKFLGFIDLYFMNFPRSFSLFYSLQA